MAEVEAEFHRRDGLTFVQATVTNSRTTRQWIRVESRLDGPIWPPDRGTAATPEWTGESWEATLEPGQTVGLGFATPAEPTEPVVEVASTRRATDDTDRERTRDVMAKLDDWSPPSDLLSGGP